MGGLGNRLNEFGSERVNSCAAENMLDWANIPSFLFHFYRLLIINVLNIQELLL